MSLMKVVGARWRSGGIVLASDGHNGILNHQEAVCSWHGCDGCVIFQKNTEETKKQTSRRDEFLHQQFLYSEAMEARSKVYIRTCRQSQKKKCYYLIDKKPKALMNSKISVCESKFGSVLARVSRIIL